MRRTTKAAVKTASLPLRSCILSAMAAMAVFCLALLLLPVVKETGLSAMENILMLPGYDMQTAELIRKIPLSSEITAIPLLRNILVENLDPLFLPVLLMPNGMALVYLNVVNILKIGAAASAMCLMLRKTVGLQNDGCMLLGTFYGICSPVMSALQNRSLLSLAVFLPLIVFFAGRAVRKGGWKHILILTCIMSLAIIICGIFCASAIVLFGLLMPAVVLPLEKTGTGERSLKILGLISSVIASVIVSAFSIIPMISLIPKDAGLKQLFVESKVSFKFFDFLLYSIDGRSPDTAVAMDPFSLSVLVILTVMLFFFNSGIKLGQKISYAVIMIFIYITVVYEPFDRIFSVWGEGGNFASARLLSLAVICFMTASVTLKNSEYLTRTAVWGAAIVMTAFLILSNTEANDLKGQVLPLYFTFAVILFWGICFSSLITKKTGYRLTLILLIALIGSVFNLTWALSKSHINRIPPDSMALLSAPEDNEDFDLFSVSSGYRYIVLSSDASDAFDTLSFPEGINALSRAALLEDIFVRAYTEEMYVKGFETVDSGLYRSLERDSQIELILKAYYVTPGSPDYYIGSDFSGTQYLTLIYTDSDETESFNGSFFTGIVPKESEFSFRIAISDPQIETAGVGIWKLDRSGYEMLSSRFRFMGKGLVIVPDEDPIWRLNGPLTIVTSIPYDPLYTVKRGDQSYEVTDCMGHLGFVIRNGGIEDREPVKIKVYKEDIEKGAVITLLALMSLGASTLYNTGRKKARKAAEKDIEGS
ncbi:MAG: YfhO family protein [Clostridiales bacterium]|nr:YfhO family protein [Clostridiales bacterium]